MTEFQRHSVLNDEATLSDDLGREAFVETLTQVLLEAETPLVVALYGPWGSGKTSMMKQLRRALMDSGSVSSRQVETVWFVPWENSKDDQPGVSLLLAIRRDLGLESTRVRQAIKAVALAITDQVQVPYLGLSLGRVRANYQQLAEQDVERRSAQALLRNHFKEVIDAARDVGGGRLKKLVMFIDDLDRCQPATAVAMLEALKLYLNFEGCIFVLGIDRQPIEAAIESEYKSLGIAKESYLDKIVQLPFTIPAISKERIDSYVEMRLPAHLRSCQQMLSLAAPDNPRQLKRTINTFLLLDRIATVSFPARDVRVLCAIALIQNSAPDLYQHLRRTPKDWSFVVPAGSEPQDLAARPNWLNEMLSGTEAREALSAALLLLRGPLAGSSAGVVDIGPYVGLSEQIGIPVSPAERVESPGPQEMSEQWDREAVGRIQEAIPRYQRALRDREGELGSDHADTLIALNDLANAYRAAGRMVEAVALYQDALDRMRRVLGDDHPDTLNAQTRLANADQAVGRTADAITLYQDALDRMKRVFGDDHRDTLITQSNLANAYQAVGRTAGAIALYQDALDRMKRVFGDDHAYTLITQSNLASSYQDEDRIEEAIALYKDVLDRMRRVFGDEHRDTLNAQAGLAKAYQAAGQNEEAIALYKDVLDRMGQVLGDEHRDTLNAQADLAEAYQMAGRTAEAIALYQDALDRMRRVLRDDHPTVQRVEARLESLRRKAL